MYVFEVVIALRAFKLFWLICVSVDVVFKFIALGWVLRWVWFRGVWVLMDLVPILITIPL